MFTKHIYALALFEKGDRDAAHAIIDETLTESMKERRCYSQRHRGAGIDAGLCRELKNWQRRI